MKWILCDEDDVIRLPATVEEIIGKFILRNETIALWYRDPNDANNKCLQYKSKGYFIPERFLKQRAIRIFGRTADTIEESNTINILVIRNEESK